MYPTPLQDLPLDEFRAAVRKRSVFDADIPIAEVRDFAVEEDGRAIPVRFYRPASAHGGLVLYIHGGGWTVCDLDTHDATCRRLANASGHAVLAVDYRLAPEHPFPAAVEDCDAVVRWVGRAGETLGIDPRRLAVSGDSAGGNLATVMSLLARDRGEQNIRAQVLVVPVTEYLPDNASYRENAEGYNLTRVQMEFFFAQYVPEVWQQRDWRAFPMLAPSLAGLPPALVITAEYDPLRDEGEAYAGRLREAGVEVTLTRYDGTLHQFLILAGVLDQGQRAVAEIGAFLRQHLA